ncbi:hypothetical protein MRY82_04295 [bacterium]|nr:hypothetical protein [bacterium]
MRFFTQLSFAFVLCGLALFINGCSSKTSGGIQGGSRSQAEKLWGNERVCLPCHAFQQPIARRHSYRCDTCHLGNPWAEEKDDAHDGLIRNPQAPENIDQTCNNCHQKVLGRDVPYSSEFIRDVVVSHKRQPGDSLEWE